MKILERIVDGLIKQMTPSSDCPATWVTYFLLPEVVNCVKTGSKKSSSHIPPPLKQDLRQARNSVSSGQLTQKNETSGDQARGYKTFSMLNSAEYKIYPAHKC